MARKYVLVVGNEQDIAIVSFKDDYGALPDMFTIIQFLLCGKGVLSIYFLFFFFQRKSAWKPSIYGLKLGCTKD